MRFIEPGPYASTNKASQHYVVGFLNYLAKHGPQQRIEVDPVDESRLGFPANDDVKEFRVGARTVEAKIDGVWTEICHVYVWDRVIANKGEPDVNGHVVYGTESKLVISQSI